MIELYLITLIVFSYCVIKALLEIRNILSEIRNELKTINNNHEPTTIPISSKKKKPTKTYTQDLDPAIIAPYISKPPLSQGYKHISGDDGTSEL